MVEQWIEDFLAAMQEGYKSYPHLFCAQLGTSDWVAAGRPHMWQKVNEYQLENEKVILLFDTGYGNLAAYKPASSMVVMFKDSCDLGDCFVLGVQEEPYAKLYKEVQPS